MKDIPGYENYQITDDGRVWSKPRAIRFNHGIRNVEGCWLQGEVGKNGYLRYKLQRNNTRRKYLAHRLVAQAYILNVDNLPDVNHKDGNKLNNHWSNLEWCTQKQNEKHKREVLKKQLGEDIGNSKLLEYQVIEIHQKYKTGLYTYDELGREYGVNKTSIYAIMNYKSWRHLGLGPS